MRIIGGHKHIYSTGVALNHTHPIPALFNTHIFVTLFSISVIAKSEQQATDVCSPTIARWASDAASSDMVLFSLPATKSCFVSSPLNRRLKMLNPVRQL